MSQHLDPQNLAVECRKAIGHAKLSSDEMFDLCFDKIEYANPQDLKLAIDIIIAEDHEEETISQANSFRALERGE